MDWEDKDTLVYVDMDDVLCDFMSASTKAKADNPAQGFPQAQVDFFRQLTPIEGAIEGIKTLDKYYTVYILTRPSIKNPLCYMEKRLWVEDHLGLDWCDRLILHPNKTITDDYHVYLIDDQPWGYEKGTQLLFGSESCPDWDSVLRQLNITQSSS